jgi:hypothetical protein
MRGVQSFLVERLPEMFDYIRVVSTPRSEESHQTQSEEARVRSRAVRVLHERKRSMPELHRETIPHLPHFLDIPRHLAIITSSVSRYSRESPLAQDPIVADLISQCNDVEQQALSDVSYQMAPRVEKPIITHPLASSEPSLPSAISSYETIATPHPLSLGSSSRIHPSYSRPKTAPSGALSDDPPLHSGASSPHSREFTLSEVNVSTETTTLELTRMATVGMHAKDKWLTTHNLFRPTRFPSSTTMSIRRKNGVRGGTLSCAAEEGFLTQYMDSQVSWRILA